MRKSKGKHVKGRHAKKSSKRMLWILIVGMIIVLAAGAAVILFVLKQEPEPLVEPASSTVSEEPPVEYVVQDFFKDYLQKNSDVVGYIKIPGTDIDYPVVKSYDENDVFFYLYKDLDKQQNSSGSLFLDYYNDIKQIESYGNYVIYGHNMRNGSMFGELMRYKNEDFLKENNIIEFDTLYGNYKWQIFSAYVTDVSFNYIQTQFSSQDEFGTLLDEMIQRSKFDTGIVPTKDDTILTLSTCTYEYDDARFVIHARMIR